MQASRLFIGMISGTSADGIDCALVRESDGQFAVEHTTTLPYDADLERQLSNALLAPADLAVTELGKLDGLLGDAFAKAALSIMRNAKVNANDVTAIGSHGQTLFHSPDSTPPFSLQLGDAARIAQQSGIQTVSDFRRADIAAGGQGAPLAPLLHEHWFGQRLPSAAIVNLGGIANLTILKNGNAIAGFDTGPANGLMDLWARWCRVGNYDVDGQLAARGEVDQALLASLLSDPYFAKPAPKSTGREHFNAKWLADRIDQRPETVATLDTSQRANIMSTLCELSAVSIADALANFPSANTLVLCGGGAHNRELRRRLTRQLPAISVNDSNVLGCDPDFIEAALFAWMAAQRIDSKTVDTRHFTGATMPIIAGSIHAATGDLS